MPPAATIPASWAVGRGSGACRVAVLLACFNRVRTTLAGLAGLMAQRLPPATELAVYLVDDGSTDGTGEAVRQAFPQVRVLTGDGNLFYVGAMRLAQAAAQADGHDAYLWLNDDTVLRPDAVARLLATAAHLAARGTPPALVAGATCDPQSGATTYGGYVRAWYHPLKFRLLDPGTEPRRCEVTAGNCTLVPAAVVARTGNFDPLFAHHWGDFDYALRARRAGCECWLAAGYAGTCAAHGADGLWRDPRVSWRERWRRGRRPNGWPWRDTREFARRYGGPLWPLYWLLPYRRVWFPGT
jgi:GT2 family glycosyltransferase